MAKSDVEITLGLDSSKAEADAKSAGKKVGDKAGDGIEKGLDEGSKDGSEKVKKNVDEIGGTLKAALGAAAFGAAVAGMKELVDVTNEYQEDMGKLATSAQVNNVAVDAANAAYKDMVGILGETDRSVEAVNHLFTLTQGSTEDLSKWTDIAAGVYATFGDSLPLEGLTEAANETARVAKVTGPFADALNWANVSAQELAATLPEGSAAQAAFNKAVSEGATVEDAYTAALAATSDEGERAQIVTGTLNGLYGEAGQIYQDTNSDLIEYRKSQDEFTEAMSALGEVLMPVVTDITDFATTLAEKLQPALQWLVDNGDLVSAALVGIGTAVAGIMVINALPGIIAAVTAAWTALNAVFAASPIGFVIMLIAGLVAGLIYFFTQTETGQQIWEEFTNFLTNAAEVISWALGTAANWIRGKWDELTQFMGSIPGKISEFFQSIPGTVKGVFDNAVNGAREAFDGLVETVRGIPGRVLGALGDLGGLLVNSGASLIDGFIRGIQGAAANVGSAISGVLSKIRSFFPFSPAKRGPFSGRGYTTYSGRALMRDFGKGIAEGVKVAEAEAEAALASVGRSLSVNSSLGFGAGSVQYVTNNNQQSIAFNQPVQSPDQIARAMRMQARYGLAGAR